MPLFFEDKRMGYVLQMRRVGQQLRGCSAIYTETDNWAYT